MKKETLAQDLAKKAFLSPKFQKSWRVHEQAFGPILTPAFAEDYQARVHLTAALNLLSRKHVRRAFPKLRKLMARCVNDADWAAVAYFMGLSFEMHGDRHNMLILYSEAGNYHHKFYLPYLKLAKCAHEDARFDTAEENYRMAISCLDGVDARIAASACANLASCLTMMHRYDEASAAIAQSKEILPNLPERFATEAMLYAVLGQTQQVSDCLDKLDALAPQMTEYTEKLVNRIMTHQHPQFSENDEELDAEKAIGFWKWFTENQKAIRVQCQNGQPEEFELDMNANFPYLERHMQLTVSPKGDRTLLTFSDFYMTALHKDLEALLLLHPEALDQDWEFSIVH